MKAEQITSCASCKKGMMHDGSILFYRVTVEPFVLDMAAVQRRHGEEMMMGPLAASLGRQEDLAKTVEGTETQKLICSSCLLTGLPVASLIEDD